MSQLSMSRQEREAFLAALHVGLLAVDRPDGPPLVVPIWYRYTAGGVVEFNTEGGTVVVTNEFGGVKVSRGEGKDVRVHLRKVVYVPTESAARALADRVKLASDVDGH